MESDVGRFAIMPAWVLEAGISARALRLYCVLGLHADYESGVCTPGRKRLARMMGCSVDSVDKAKSELVKIGALQVTSRKSERGDPTSNEYVLCLAKPGGSRHAAATPQDSGYPSRHAAATMVNENQVDETLSLLGEPGESLPPEWTLKEVDKRPVTRGEASVAMAVMGAFNRLASTRFKSDEYYRGIVMRVREHPEVTIEQHEEIIRRVLQDPWWRGSPSPNLIYGKGSTFERAQNGSDDRRSKLDVYG